jgi:hypothetical protein
MVEIISTMLIVVHSIHDKQQHKEHAAEHTRRWRRVCKWTTSRKRSDSRSEYPSSLFMNMNLSFLLQAPVPKRRVSDTEEEDSLAEHLILLLHKQLPRSNKAYCIVMYVVMAWTTAVHFLFFSQRLSWFVLGVATGVQNFLLYVETYGAPIPPLRGPG